MKRLINDGRRIHNYVGRHRAQEPPRPSVRRHLFLMAFCVALIMNDLTYQVSVRGWF